MNTSEMYVTPKIKICSSFEDAKDFYDKNGGAYFLDFERPLDIIDIAKGERNLIVGEPGVGKSLLLEKIKQHFDGHNCIAKLISLRLSNANDLIDEFIGQIIKTPKVLLLDALDEVKSDLFPSILQKIEEVSLKYPEVRVFLSSRWHFINRYSNSFPNYRFIILSPFTQEQVRNYLTETGHIAEDIDALISRVMPFSHRMLVIQVPRYLAYLEDYLNKNGLDKASNISRNELFEYFIYKKLEHEDTKLGTDKRDVIKRVLEKLALTMEIYQSNVLTKDELMTFFDELKSDLKVAVLSQIDLKVFYDCYLLKNNEDSIEFDNTEFQEYLAAKEIKRLPDSNRSVFSFSIDPIAKEIYPTWFNALTFLVDMQVDLLEQLVEFSGIQKVEFKIMDEAFLLFLSRVNPKNVSLELKRKLFNAIIAYHQRTLQWLPGKLTLALPGYYDSSLEQGLKDGLKNAEKKKDEGRFVPLGNVSYVVGYLLESGISIDRTFWKEKLITYASDKNENGVLQRHALFALEQLGDSSVLDVLPDLTESDELVTSAFLDLCTKLDPDNPKCLGYFFSEIKRDHFQGRYGIYRAKKADSVKLFLNAFTSDKDFRREFLKDTSLFKDKDHILIENIEAVFDEEYKELCKKAIIQSVHYDVAHFAERSVFIIGLWKLLWKSDSNFVSEMVERIKSSPDGKSGLYYANNLFAEVIEEKDVNSFIETMISIGEKYSAFSVMQQIKISKRNDFNNIYEAGRSKLAEDYSAWEERLAQPDNSSKSQDEELLQEFTLLLEPEPGKFSHGVFEHYNRNRQHLDQILKPEQKSRLTDLLTGTIFKFIDPGQHDLTITSENNGSKSFTTNSGVHAFGDALITAKHLAIDVSPFRQHIINFIPFAYSDQLGAIFDLVKNVSSAEMIPVLNVYKEKNSDLWRHQPVSFVEAVEKYHITEGALVLRQFIKEQGCDKYTREKALVVYDALIADVGFLKEIFGQYKDSLNSDEKSLAYKANAILIGSHAESEAIRWRLGQLVEKMSAFVRPRGIHNVAGVEEEIADKAFAKPLMDLKNSEYEKDYLELLIQAMKVWAKGREFHAYAGYLWEIVYAYYDNLKEKQSYDPLHRLEGKITEIKDQTGANWLAGRMVQLRRSYLSYLGKPRNVSEAIRRYNDAREYNDRKIINSSDLFRHLQDALQTDLKRWIEGEGVYDLIIGEKVYKNKRNEYEKLIQRTLKAQVENILYKSGFQVEVIREPELLGGKKTDFYVRYGFVGPIIVEVKLTSNSDLKRSKLDTSPSYLSMEQYMKGYYATHGILLVINNNDAKNLLKIKNTFQRIPNVWVQSFDCYKMASVKK